MELNYDWRSFQSFFYSKKRFIQQEVTCPIYLIVEGRIIISVLSDQEDLSDWIGATLDEMQAEFAHRELIACKREKVDEWIESSIDLPHFYDQVQALRQEAQSGLIFLGRAKGPSSLTHEHFILQAIRTWWQKLLPSNYGIFICLDSKVKNSIFLKIQRGRVEFFHVPDFSQMIPERRKFHPDMIRYLSEKYLVPVQGLFLTSTEWNEWSELSNPWPKIMTALKSNRNKMVPFKWSFASMIAGRAYFGI